MTTRFAVVAVWAQDVNACAHFYRDVLGLEMMGHHDGRPHFQVGGIYFLILRGKPHPAEDAQPDRFPLFALSVDDLEAAVRGLDAHGVPMPWGIEQNATERWVMFRDPGGNLIELVQWGA